ncbi:MAG: histidine phosphatase family protein [bacterium]|nr:MAG: histidine phosphatase family protein [bacterium]
MGMIYLVRHGETYWNVEGRIQGQTQTDLTPKGIEQSEWLAECLKSKTIDRIICSELIRSQKTAKQINIHHNLQLEINPKINECSWGKWEGLTHIEVKQKYPDEYKSRKENIWYFSPKNGESYDDLYDRLYPVAFEFAAMAIAENLIIVSHAMVNKVLLGIFLDLPVEEIIKIAHPNDVVYLISRSSDQWIVKHTHLEGSSVVKGYLKFIEI